MTRPLTTVATVPKWSTSLGKSSARSFTDVTRVFFCFIDTSARSLRKRSFEIPPPQYMVVHRIYSSCCCFFYRMQYVIDIQVGWRRDPLNVRTHSTEIDDHAIDACYCHVHITGCQNSHKFLWFDKFVPVVRA